MAAPLAPAGAPRCPPATRPAGGGPRAARRVFLAVARIVLMLAEAGAATLTVTVVLLGLVAVVGPS